MFDYYGFRSELKKIGKQDVPDRLWYRIEDTILQKQQQVQLSWFKKPQLAVGFMMMLILLVFTIPLGQEQLQKRRVNLYLSELGNTGFESTFNYEDLYL